MSERKRLHERSRDRMNERKRMCKKRDRKGERK
jgi:hypothetical protein